MKEDVLYIFDISSFMYVGSYNTKPKIKSDIIDTPEGYTQKTIDCGGIKFLFDEIWKVINRGRLIFVEDKEPDYILEIFPDYKKRRKIARAKDPAKAENIDRQKDLAVRILKDCGFQVISQDRHEGDAVEVTLCKQYKDKYDKIYVYNNDHDLYCVVDDNVEVLPIGKKGRHVTKANYELNASKERIIPFNTISFDKMLNGCSSDDVPALRPKSLRDEMSKFFDTPEWTAAKNDREYMKEVIDALYPQANDQFEIIYPMILDGLYIDHDMIHDYGNCLSWSLIVGCYSLPERKGINSHVLEIKNSFFQ